MWRKRAPTPGNVRADGAKLIFPSAVGMVEICIWSHASDDATFAQVLPVGYIGLRARRVADVDFCLYLRWPSQSAVGGDECAVEK